MEYLQPLFFCAKTADMTQENNSNANQPENVIALTLPLKDAKALQEARKQQF